jgi:hypothetical protein
MTRQLQSTVSQSQPGARTREYRKSSSFVVLVAIPFPGLCAETSRIYWLVGKMSTTTMTAATSYVAIRF